MKKSSNIFIVFIIFIFGLFIVQNGIQVNASNTTENTNPYENLHFSLYNNSSAYKVSAANKQITEAIIPATYNGLPVTEIADNGFSSCTNLTYVFVPHSVTKIGSNAFINCANLEKILGMPKVKIYGNNWNNPVWLHKNYSIGGIVGIFIRGTFQETSVNKENIIYHSNGKVKDKNLVPRMRTIAGTIENYEVNRDFISKIENIDAFYLYSFKDGGLLRIGATIYNEKRYVAGNIGRIV